MNTADPTEAPSEGASHSGRLDAFLREWLGQWPPVAVAAQPAGPPVALAAQQAGPPSHASAVTVVGYPDRDKPGWDGAVHDVVGVARPAGAVVSVPPARADEVRAAARAWEDLPRVLPAAMGRPDAPAYLGHFRWCDTPAGLPDAGVWLPATDPRLPEWLRPFGGDVLVALEGDTYAAGVGLKRHNGYGVEVAVGTDPAHRGRGLAARLCAQAARRILADGAAPIYLHDPANIASARTADAAGFPFHGWQVLGMPAVRGPLDLQ